MPQLNKQAVTQSVLLPTELRIGNLTSAGIVVEIQKNCFYVHDGESSLKNTLFDIHQIPLTEDIISNICFNENKVMGMYRLEATEDYSISFALDNDMIYIGDDIEIRISETPLHRFQNIYFSLTGRELTVA